MAKEIKIKGQGSVKVRSELLRPLKRKIRQNFAANDNKLEREELRDIRSTIKGFEGRISDKDLISAIGETQGFGWQESLLAEGAVRNFLDANRYSNFIDRQRNRISGFTERQSSMINDIMSRSQQSIANQLGMIQSQADQSLGSFTSMLDMAMARSSEINAQQRSAFEAANAASEQAIKQYQSQIAGLPGFTPIDQISDTPDQVSGWNNLRPIGVQRQAAQVQRTPAMTGFSSQQKASRQRQQQGIQGFRRRAA